ncbi:RdgB/HAM1 family non-canonical purine NTP pyrophosphatase [Anaerorhabdus furcosa]|uniref:dITP/XTP pyrophosphatase n=1 Tax=Anaerorhabdus furcosa TaxID=118967 RepID=A0A1T4PER4_9FIRM|nr:RdgB/HAM1 family non-canonical purine NTP pyrophosphatase [Anaerorhabdus furcosa]SJZ90055.1 XTP/dITP diphosphohydrolase [Anaerorhabdus furcosa]
MKDLFIASANAHKIEEFKHMLEPLGYQIRSINDLPEVIDIEETGVTFEENAIIKAQTITDKFNIPCISDDSGLEIDALNKEPGVQSARYLGHDTSYDIKNNTLLERMKNESNRACRFVCAIALSVPGKEPVVFRDTIEGTVATSIEGNKGFGYDPIVYYEPFKTTLANVSEEKKNSVSHRGKALQKLLEYLNETPI